MNNTPSPSIVGVIQNSSVDTLLGSTIAGVMENLFTTQGMTGKSFWQLSAEIIGQSGMSCLLFLEARHLLGTIYNTEADIGGAVGFCIMYNRQQGLLQKIQYVTDNHIIPATHDILGTTESTNNTTETA